MKRKRIDKSVLKFGIPTRIRDKDHLAFLRKLPCCVTLSALEVQAAHLPEKSTSAMADKANDYMAVPLQALKHRRQHDIGHPRFWEPYGGVERAQRLALDLWDVSGDLETGKKLVWEFYFGGRK
jgi:hypothetical protein